MPSEILWLIYTMLEYLVEVACIFIIKNLTNQCYPVPPTSIYIYIYKFIYIYILSNLNYIGEK